jgi:hypothetical protein
MTELRSVDRMTKSERGAYVFWSRRNRPKQQELMTAYRALLAV